MWKFCRDLLQSRKHRDVIDWENKHELVFKIKNPNKMGILWGEAKHNKNMDYDKMSRAIRYAHRMIKSINILHANNLIIDLEDRKTYLK